MLFDVVIAYPGNWNAEKKRWNNSERTEYEIEAENADAATAIIQKKIDNRELDCSVALPDFNEPHEIEPIIINTLKSEDNEYGSPSL